MPDKVRSVDDMVADMEKAVEEPEGNTSSGKHRQHVAQAIEKLISSQIIDGKLRYIEDGTGSKAATKTAPTLLTLAAVVQGMVSEMSGRKMSYTITIEGKGAAAAAPKPFKTGKLCGRPPKDPAKKAAEAEQKRRDAHKKATIDFDKVYDDRKRYLDAGIGDEFAGWRADIERLPDRFARPFQSRPRGASRPVRLGLPGRFGVRTGCQFPQVCPPPCRSATSGAPGTNLGYLTDPRYYAARTAYFRCGKFCSRLRCFSVFRPRSAGVSARRSARVCLGRRSLGRNFFPA